MVSPHRQTDYTPLPSHSPWRITSARDKNVLSFDVTFQTEHLLWLRIRMKSLTGQPINEQTEQLTDMLLKFIFAVQSIHFSHFWRRQPMEGQIAIIKIFVRSASYRGGIGKSIWGSHPSCVRLRQLWLYDWASIIKKNVALGKPLKLSLFDT